MESTASLEYEGRRVLQDKLIADGLLKPDGLRQALDHQKKFGCALEDSLVALRLLPERDILRVLAREYRMQYLTVDKVEQIRVDDELLELLPVRVAESAGVVPFRFDVDDTLWLISRGPLSPEDREKIVVRSGARQVTPLLARASVVGAAIRRHYYSDHSAYDLVRNLQPKQPEKQAAARLDTDPVDGVDIITLSKELKCPACGAPASLDDFQCGRCLLLLNPEAGGSDPKIENSLIRAFLSVTESRPFLKVPDPPPRDTSSEPTRVVAAPLDRRLIPRLTAGLDLALKPMHRFEAYVASFIDGTQDIEALINQIKLPRAEVHALLHSFKQRGIIALAPPQPAPAASPAPAVTPPAPAAMRRSGPVPVPVPTPFPAGRQTPRTPATGLPPAASAARPPDPAAGGGGFRVLTRSEAQKARDAAPPSPAPPAAPSKPAEVRTEADTLLQTAVAMERRGDLDGAIYILKKGISQLKEPAPLYNKLALILIHQRRDYRQAEELLHKALELEPENQVFEKNLYKVVTLAALKSQG